MMFDKFHHQSGSNPTSPPSGYSNQDSLSSTSSSSSFAPRVFNVNNNDIVHARLVILDGTAGPQQGGANSSVVVYHHVNSFPSQRFQVTDGYFKAFVHLNPGVNNLRIVWSNGDDDEQSPSSQLTLNYVPLLQNPPLHYALIVAKDSPFLFDSPTYKKEQEGGNGLDLAIKKVRLASYMMAAYTGEQMRRAGFGHRTFRPHEEYDKDTLSDRDRSLRSTTKVHVIQSNLTVDEIRDPNRAQQNSQGTDRGALFGIALDAIRNSGNDLFADKGENVMVAAIILDGHWDVQRKLIVGHAALGGSSGHIRLGIFGSHALWSFPTSIEQITPCYLDETRVDTNQIAKDCSGEGTAWEVYNVGFGAWLHEIGHLLGCPHQPYGIMLRDWYINRSFMSREGYASGPKTNGKRPIRAKDESVWHPLDLLRFRFHPAFRSPFENRVEGSKIGFFPLENGVLVRTMTGIYLVEIYVDDKLQGWLKFLSPQQETFLFEDDLLGQVQDLGARDPNKKLTINVLGLGESQETVQDFRELARSDQIHDTFFRNRGVVTGFRSLPIGSASGQLQTAIFPPDIRGVNVRCGAWIDAIEFIPCNDNGDPANGPQRPRVGGTGGGANQFLFQEGEYLVGFFIRAGAWLDAVQIITNIRRSPIYGNSQGGGPFELYPPPGYELVGIKAHVESWLKSFSVVYISKD
ncbi:uncharacterized protein SAPINGB_P005283 [Magnusiomyces paraingens]|uniref:Jacalin-type lectin domain-containing protein n=1 Tax=Magnusiomyces paraingens TaxID=2606893 RepID=A0A5E8C6D8_9ASCO|nr:uncharacterized protein SAPINGB_P005283 [Saprochaete ingens]VVT56796.1 unnamed protein product [Saprochaete ingens]